MNLLQVFLAISGILIFLLALDISKRQRFNALHFVVFLGIGIGILVFTFVPDALNALGRVFGLQRGADLLVYASIVFLLYFVLLLLNKTEKTSSELTALIREIAIQNAPKASVSGEIAFVMAAYNEVQVVETTVRGVMDSGYGPCVAIADGPRDGTTEVLEKLVQEFGTDRIVLLKHLKNRGQGAALETGFEYLRRYGNTRYVSTYDSDGQMRLSDIPAFLEQFEKCPGLEIAIGSRFLHKEAVGMPFSRQVILKLGLAFMWIISQIRLTDSQNGYRVMRSSALDKIRITLDGMGHASEILDIIATKKLHFAEVPVTIDYTDYTLAKGQKSSNAIKIATRLIWNKFFR